MKMRSGALFVDNQLYGCLKGLDFCRTNYNPPLQVSSGQTQNWLGHSNYNNIAKQSSNSDQQIIIDTSNLDHVSDVSTVHGGSPKFSVQGKGDLLSGETNHILLF